MRKAELHEFRGRLFVTDGWASAWGCALDDTGERFDLSGHVGGLLIEAMRRSRGLDFDAWETFCASVAGVRVEEYRPERRVTVCEIGERIWLLQQPDHAKPPEGNRELSMDSGWEALGEAALQLLRGQAPNWPVVESAAIHVASRKRLVIYPTIVLAGPPVYVVSIDAPHDEIGGHVHEALSASPFAGDPEDPETAERWEAALGNQGVAHRHMARRRAASVDVRSDGTVEVSAMRATRGGWEGIPGAEAVLADRRPETLGRAVVVAVRDWDPLGQSQLGSHL